MDKSLGRFVRMTAAINVFIHQGNLGGKFMKKVFSILLVMTMLVGAVVCHVSAAPTLYMYDDFENNDQTLNKWIWSATKFYIEDGILNSAKDGVVHQSEGDNGYSWTELAAQVDMRFVACDEGQSAGLWFRISDTSVLQVKIDPNAKKIFAECDGQGVFAEKENINVSIGEEADFVTLGMRVSADGKLDVYFDYEEVLTDIELTEYAAFDSVFLLTNGTKLTQWDNVTVASVDYDLTKTIEENGLERIDPNDVPTDTDDTSADDTSADDTSADDTSADDTSADDTSAEDTSADDTTAGPAYDTTAPADDTTDSEAPVTTDKGTDDNKAPQTGDTTVLFVIAAVAALGLAIVVKKIAAK